MPRSHFYLVASVPPSVGASMLSDALALRESVNDAKTHLAPPEVTLTNDPADTTRLRASIHFHILEAERPNQLRRAIVDLFKSWKDAGALLDEARLDDEDVFAERPELKRRRNGETAPKPVSVQRDEALADAADLRAELARATSRIARDAALIAAAQSERDATAVAHRAEIASYEALVEAVRAFLLDPVIDDLRAAFAPFAEPED